MAHGHVTTDYGTGKKKLSIYAIGIALCVLLTLIPFGAVMQQGLSRIDRFETIFLAAIAQLVVQVVCFLRLNTRTEQSRMNTMSFLFCIVILAVVIGGSLWIMWNLNYNMM